MPLGEVQAWSVRISGRRNYGLANRFEGVMLSGEQFEE